MYESDQIGTMKKALYAILEDEEQTEKAFASIADMKYNYKVLPEKEAVSDSVHSERMDLLPYVAQRN